MSEDEIRASILEEMYEYHWREATAMSRCLIFVQDHYTYRDLERAHLITAEWTARELMGLLKYDESEKRLRIIRDRVIADHKQLMEAEKIA